jgi:hypothetical protein
LVDGSLTDEWEYRATGGPPVGANWVQVSAEACSASVNKKVKSAIAKRIVFSFSLFIVFSFIRVRD